MTLFYRLEIILMLDIKPIEEKDIDMALNIYPELFIAPKTTSAR